MELELDYFIIYVYQARSQDFDIGGGGSEVEKVVIARHVFTYGSVTTAVIIMDWELDFISEDLVNVVRLSPHKNFRKLVYRDF